MDVDGWIVSVLARSPTHRAVLASLTHSKKFEPLAFNGLNYNDCILFSKTGLVDIVCTTIGLLTMIQI